MSADERDGLPPAQAAKPSPEDMFSMVNVYLTDANLDTPLECIKGIRAVLSAAKGERVPLGTAKLLWDRYKAGTRPILLGLFATAEEARAAAEAGLEASDKNVVIGSGLDASDIRAVKRGHAEATEGPQEPEESDLPQVEDADEDPAIEIKAAKVALVLMAMNEGSPTRSYTFAKILRKDTGDSLWTDVANLVDASFPNVMGEDVSG
jgi:hypothetical protein